MKRFSFVILNYHTSYDTIKCIQSILKLSFDGVNVSVIIVDNGSSKEELALLYNFCNKVHSIKCVILEMYENVGFSKANNAGYKYAKDNESPDFIAISNSDIIIEQKDFITQIYRVYETEEFSILGPDVYVPRKRLHQSPVIGRNVLDRCFVESEIRKCKEKIRLLEEKKDKGKKNAIVDGRTMPVAKNILKNVTMTIMHKGYTRQYTGEYIHGAFIICSSIFIEKYDRCFEPEVFLYGEEDLLLRKCLINGDKVLYSPIIKVLHFSGVTSSSRPDISIDKQLFYWKNELKSKEILLSQFR